MSDRESERERDVCVSDRVRWCVCERVRWCVCVCVRERCVCVRETDRQTNVLKPVKYSVINNFTTYSTFLCLGSCCVV